MVREQSSPIFAATLSNGLGVLLKEDHTAPIASFWTWYRVGSRNELPGTTGISHWVEHMQFKGTDRIAKGQIFRDVSRVGGTLNALTSQDWTAYFETLPADQIELSLSVESDRMRNSRFEAEEVESERTVILSERQGAENNPGYSLYEEVNGIALQAHPYRHMVIGYETDLRQITRDELYEHYQRFYQPSNAYIVAVGDFDTHDLLTRIEGSFGHIPSEVVAPRAIRVQEPPQPGERRVTIRKPSGVPYLRMAFHAPAAKSEDLVPLLVAEAVLSGGQPMGFGGGGSMGRSSRLYRSLVATGVARAAGSDASITIDPYLFQIGVTGLPNSDLPRVEQIIDSELQRLREEPVANDEISRAVRQLEAQFIYSSEGVTNQAYWLGQWDIVDRWARAETLPDEMRAVTADDVQRVAQRYLVEERRTIGWLVPSARSASGTLNEPEVNAALFAPTVWGIDGPRTSGSVAKGSFERAVLPNGIPVLGQDRPASRSVVMRVRVPAGSTRETDSESGLAHLTARASLRGSANASFEEINLRTDELGSSMTLDAGRQFAEARVRCLTDDFAEMVERLAQTLLAPDFPFDEVEKVKAEQLGAISESDNDTRSMADRLLRRGVYPDPNPLGRRVLGVRELVEQFDREALNQFHRRTYRPGGASIAVVGGFGSFDRALDSINRAFGSWLEPAEPQVTLDLARTSKSEERVQEAIEGKSQADLAVGMATISRGHRDYYALDIANLILGRLGLMGRLGAEVRDRNGLAYYAFSQIEPRTDGSLWSARAGVDPGNVDRALMAIVGEVARIQEELVTEEELHDAQSYLIGVLPLALETHDGVASTLLALEEFELGLDHLTRYPDIIAGITRAHVLDAAQHHLDLTRRVVAVAAPM